MPTTSDEFAYARSWIGEQETQAEFDARFDRLLPDSGGREEALNAAIEESIRAQLTAITLGQPSSMSISGISASFGQNIQTLERLLKDFITTGGGSGSVRVSPQHREDFVNR